MTGAPPSRAGAPIYAYNGGFFWQKRLRRMLHLAGYDLRLGLPPQDGQVAVWGQSPTSGRGESIAARRGARLIRVEDAFLRSLHPGRTKAPPLGLLIDDLGVHFDGRAPSRLERILATDPLDDTALLDRARAAMAQMQRHHLTKYCATDPSLPAPAPGYVLVVDQTAGDASLRASGATRAHFLEMLMDAREAHPGAPILVKAHPETTRGLRPGHLTPEDLPEGAQLIDTPLSPWVLLEGAIAVYTVSSQLGFEAILAGHKPQVYGQPFYAGWGLTEDRQPIGRRQRRLTRAQLFAGAMILAPIWYDPYRDCLTDLETVIETLKAEARAWREDRQGWVAQNMRLWKRGAIQRRFGGQKPVRFAAAAPAQPEGRRSMIWGASDAPADVRVEDGLIRSRGLGAALVPPLSLVLDDLGIYFDATQPSRLDRLIAQARPDASERRRTERLIARLRAEGLSKYNTGAPPPPLPEGPRVLVVGQVEDDASIRLGCPGLRDNRALLLAAREAHPGAALLWKPHPDVEAGLRPGAVPDADQIADQVLTGTDPAPLLEQVDAVWTLSSLMGFEALLRSVPVTCLGMPFYAGWGLTKDHTPAPEWRSAQPDLIALTHAVLIQYPRYWDPVTGRPCPVEVVLDRLSEGYGPAQGPALRLLSKAQGALASLGLWR